MNALWMIIPGASIAAGVVLIATTFRPRHARLGDALAVLASPPVSLASLPAEGAPAHGDAEPAGLDRLGTWWIRTRRVAVPATLERTLRLRGRTLSSHYAHKLVAGMLGLLAPFVVTLLGWAITGSPPIIPVLAAPLLAVAGFVAPDVLVRRGGAQAAEDATESLLTFFDLATLERLANQSATQALHAAASVSDAPVFTAIRGALDRARLQQRPPHADLRDLSRELDLPALRDLADVMRLDEAGASLSGALRARVRELRDAHLNAMKMAATEGSERMTTWMVIPSLAFGLFFLVPPLLTLVAGG